MNTTVLSVLFGLAFMAGIYVISQTIEKICNKLSAK